MRVLVRKVVSFLVIYREAIELEQVLVTVDLDELPAVFDNDVFMLLGLGVVEQCGDERNAILAFWCLPAGQIGHRGQDVVLRSQPVDMRRGDDPLPVTTEHANAQVIGIDQNHIGPVRRRRRSSIHRGSRRYDDCVHEPLNFSVNSVQYYLVVERKLLIFKVFDKKAPKTRLSKC